MVTSGGANQELEKRIHHFLTDKKHFLDLSNLGLTELPPPEDLFPQGLTLLSHLHILDISLHILDISHNNIRQLPSWFKHSSGLRSLIASDNRLQELPDYIGELRSLEHLDLRNNRLWFLPPSMLQLTNLKRLYLHNNFLDLPPEVLGDEPWALPSFFQHIAPSRASASDYISDYQRAIETLAYKLWEQSHETAKRA